MKEPFGKKLFRNINISSKTPIASYVFLALHKGLMRILSVSIRSNKLPSHA